MKAFISLRNRFKKNLLKNQSGQGATEYILLLAVVVGLVMVFGKPIKEKVLGATEKVGQNMDSVIDEASK